MVKPERRRIVAAIDKLKNNLNLGTQLSGKWKGLRRLRVGDYRIIYGIKSKHKALCAWLVAHGQSIKKKDKKQKRSKNKS